MITPYQPKIGLFVILSFVSFSSVAQMRRIYLDGSGMNNDLRKFEINRKGNSPGLHKF